jgi:hypothetical protein
VNADDLAMLKKLIDTGHPAGVIGTAQSGAADALRRLAARHYPAPIYIAPRTGMGVPLVLPGLLDFGKKRR